MSGSTAVTNEDVEAITLDWVNGAGPESFVEYLISRTHWSEEEFDYWYQTGQVP